MEKIEIKKNQTKSFIGSWSINNDSLAEDIINFFDKNHERHKLSTSLIGKIDKKQKNFIEFKITAKEINDKKIVIFSKFVEILVSCFKDYKKNISHWFINHPTVCYRKHAVLKVGNYNADIKVMAEDFELELRMLKEYGYIYNFNEPLLRYRIHPGQVTFKGGDKGSVYWNTIRKSIINNFIND